MKFSKDVLTRTFLPLYYHKRESDDFHEHITWSKLNHIVAVIGALLFDIVILIVILLITLFANFILGVIVLVFYDEKICRCIKRV
jgi:hypothetical protein